MCNLETKRCNCTEYFTSGICEQHIGCYDQEPQCQNHGICDMVGGHCRCEPPFTGQLCETSFFCFEDGGKCFNNGTCPDDECICEDPSTFGDFCEIRSDCMVAECSIGGACNNNTRSCICPDGFSGHLCDIMEVPCDESDCRNNTECSPRGGPNSTACLPDSYGSASFSAFFSCSSDDECSNEGVCDESGLSCDCVDDFVDNLAFVGGNCGFIDDSQPIPS